MKDELRRVLINVFARLTGEATIEYGQGLIAMAIFYLAEVINDRK